MLDQLDLFAASSCDYEEEQKEKEVEKVSKLSPRQWKLYRLIYDNSVNYQRKTTKREIYEALKDYGYEWNDSDTTHDNCSAIWTDITANNLSFAHDKIIISKNDEYWIGTKEDTDNFLNDLWNQLAPRLMRYWFYKSKVKGNGQGKLLSNELLPIDDNSKAREFVESYNPYEVE